MKKMVVTMFIICTMNPEFSFGQCDAWTQKADFGGIARRHGVGFSIGDKGYIGTGIDAGSTYYKDFWEYDPASNTWSQKADFGGTARYGAVGFSIGNKGYVGTGKDVSINHNDFWEYDQLTNIWTQKANFAGAARRLGAGFSIAGKGYIGTGWTGAFSKDFWEYDPISDIWTQKTDFGGAARYRPVGFAIENKGYIGVGHSGSDRRDFWEFDPGSNAWNQKADFGGTARDLSVGFSIVDKGYIGTGDDGSGNRDFWEFNPSSNVWIQKADFGGTARWGAVGFSIGSYGYLGSGFDVVERVDFWRYTPSGPQIDSISSLDAAMCFADSNGSITVVASGLSTLSYSVDNGITYLDSTGIFSNLASGTYMVMVQDNNGCTIAGDTIEFIPPPLLVVDSIGQENLLCTGDSSGSIVVAASGGTGILTYSNDSGLSFPDTVGMFTNLPQGNYVVMIQDGNGCVTAGDTVQLISPPALTIDSIDQANLLCNGDSTGSISVLASGGTGSLNYSNNSGSTFVNSTGMFINLPQGNYVVMVQDNNGCVTAGDTVQLISPPALTIDSIDQANLLCNGDSTGSIVVAASGGTGILTYSNDSGLSFPDTVGMFTNLPQGNYVVMIQDGNGCVTPGDTVQLISPPALTITSIDQANLLCNGDSTGSISVLASGGTGSLNYSNDSGSTFANSTGAFVGLISDTYYMFIQDANGCAISGGAVMISEPMVITTSNISSTPDSNNASDGIASISLAGGTTPYAFIWTPSGQTDSVATGLTAGMYEVNVQDDNGCTHVDSVLVDAYVGVGDKNIVRVPIRLYPNPSTGKFTVRFGIDQLETVNVRVFNKLGQEIFSRTLNQVHGSFEEQIDLRRYPAGVYSFQLIMDRGVVNRQFIIE